MDNQKTELLEIIRQQYENTPYPRKPLDASPKNDPNFLYFHNLVSAYYLRNQQFINTEGKVILDAGCGSGYKALALAIANPGAKIVGIDFSAESVKLAQQRLEFHGIKDAEFHVLPLEELPSLGLQFDYINNDEVLYLLNDPVAGLQAMQAVLKPEGIIRTNLHSSLQRVHFFRAQEIFKLMGLLDDTPKDLEVDMVREIMRALKNQVVLKKSTWTHQIEESEETILVNYLLQGDKGYTIPEVFAVLEAAELEFISMVNWRQWNLMDLFQYPDNLPIFLGMNLPDISIQEQLHLYELLNPVHRLLDFWCGHPNQGKSFVPVAEWTGSDWQNVEVHLHPQLNTAEFKEKLIVSTNQLLPFEISQFLPPVSGFVSIDSNIAASLFPLLEKSQPIQALIERLQRLKPVNPVTFEPTTTEEAFGLITTALTGLESFGYVLLTR